jgi:preprotein translocase subunit YajC
MSHHLLGQVLAASSTNKSTGGSILSLLIFPLMFAALYFFMIRPQQRRAKAQREMQKKVDVGDEILTNSGIYGIITAMDDDDLWLEVAEGTEIRFARGAVLRVTQSASSEADDADGK